MVSTMHAKTSSIFLSLFCFVPHTETQPSMAETSKCSSAACSIHDSDLSKPPPLDCGVDQIPIVDYSLLVSDDPVVQSKALACLARVCDDFGFFYLVNGVAESVVKAALEGVSDFFHLTEEDERRGLSKKNPTDKIRWVLRSSDGENREYLKLVTHPNFHCPPNPPNFSESLQEYLKSMRKVELGLAKAISKNLGMEESFIEKGLGLESGFDVAAMNLYPPSSRTRGPVGLPDHTDPGFFVSLAQDVNGGLQILANNGDWMNVTHMPPYSIFINFGDQFEVLTNGKYKSHLHRVIVENNEVERISMVMLHGPSLDKLVTPAPEFVDDSRPLAYRGVSYRESLEINGDEIDVQSSLEQLRLA